MSKMVNFNDLNELVCPNCGSNYLHHYKVEVSDRGEDDEYVLYTSIRTGDYPGCEGSSPYSTSVKQITNTKSRNPSYRRHGLRVLFWCENCDIEPELMIAQHKGCTILEWE